MPQIPWGAPGVSRSVSPKPSGVVPAQDSYNYASNLRALRGMAGAIEPQGLSLPDLYVKSPGWDNSAAVRAMYDALRSKGKKIYSKTQGTLKDIYSDLRAAYAPLEENTRVRYNTAMETTRSARDAASAEAALRASAEDAKRRDMLARMGIASAADTGSGGAAVDLAREEGTAMANALQSNWEGLMGSMSAAQQGRDASSLRGATDQETMALEELATRWSDYQQSLAERQAQAMQGARGGGGMVLNPLYRGMPELASLARTQQFANATGIPADQLYALMNPQQGPALDPGAGQVGMDAYASYAVNNPGKLPANAYLTQEFQKAYGENYYPYLTNFLQNNPYR